MFITYEGIDGSGKTTLIRLFSDLLRDKSVDHIVTREPANLPPASISAKGLETELDFFIADRKNHIKNVIEPALNSGKIVLCDRFQDSTIAYQGYGRQMALEILEQAASGITLKPDLTFLLDLPVEMAKERICNRNHGETTGLREIFDDETYAFHTRVRNGYLELAKKETDRFVILDASKKPEDLLNNMLFYFNKINGNRHA